MITRLTVDKNLNEAIVTRKYIVRKKRDKIPYTEFLIASGELVEAMPLG